MYICIYVYIYIYIYTHILALPQVFAASPQVPGVNIKPLPIKKVGARARNVNNNCILI